MSHSTLYGITKDFLGVEISEYHNSFLFGPAIWRFLELKYHTSSVSGFTFTEGEKQINAIMNKGENFAEQICWELSNQQVFSIADKDLVADCIDKFIEVAQFVGNYDVDRFHAVAADHGSDQYISSDRKADKQTHDQIDHRRVAPCCCHGFGRRKPSNHCKIRRIKKLLQHTACSKRKCKPDYFTKQRAFQHIHLPVSVF